MKKSLQSTFLTILFITAIAAISGCSKKTETPTFIPVPIINPIISQLTSTSVIVGGRLSSSSFVTEDGICFSATNALPTVNDTFIRDTLASRWEEKITGLTPNTTYYVRTYAKSEYGVGYSDVITFKTNATVAVLTGTVTTFAGSAAGTSGYAEGTGTAALFDGPQNVAFNAATGKLYVAESFNNAIRTITTTGATGVLSKAAIGYAEGNLATAQFYGPKGLSFDVAGNTYLADLGNNVIRKITTTGAVTTLAGNTIAGFIDGAATKAEFYNPSATAVDAAGNVYVADRSNNLIRKITSAGVVSTFAGFKALNGFSQTTVPGYADGDPTLALFNYPVALTFDATGNLYVADYKNNAIRKVTPAGVVSTFAGGIYFPALLGNPTGVVLDAQGNMFISEASGRIIEITTNKVLYVLAGAAKSNGYVNGVGAAARFNSPQALTLDGQGNLYVADFNNNVIRKITVAVQ
jgi:sugar lactone lactonase YvrE